MGNADGQADFVAGRAELRVLEDRLEERLLVHFGLGFDQRVIDPLQERVFARRRRGNARALRSCTAALPRVSLTLVIEWQVVQVMPAWLVGLFTSS